MNERKREVRRLLTGKFMENEDGYVEPCTGVFNPFIGGSRNGAMSAYLFGLTTVRKRVRFTVSEEKALAYFDKKFADIGRRARLTSAPHVKCVVALPLILNSYAYTFVMSASNEDDEEESRRSRKKKERRAAAEQKNPSVRKDMDKSAEKSARNGKNNAPDTSKKPDKGNKPAKKKTTERQAILTYYSARTLWSRIQGKFRLRRFLKDLDEEYTVE